VRAGEHLGGPRGQCERVVEFTVGEQAGFRGDPRSAKPPPPGAVTAAAAASPALAQMAAEESMMHPPQDKALDPDYP